MIIPTPTNSDYRATFGANGIPAPHVNVSECRVFSKDKYLGNIDAKRLN
jgi:hypothetical protein